MDELTLLAELAPEQGTVTGAEHAQKKVCGEATFIEVTWDSPAGDTLGGVDFADKISTTDTALGRFLVCSDINERAASETTEPTFGGGEDFLWGHATAQGEHDVRRDITTGVISTQVVRRDAHKEVAMANHRLP